MISKRKIFFRADASWEIGYGHFIRSLALADMLKDDFDCTFFTAEPTEYQQRQINDVCKSVELPHDDRKYQQFLDLLQGDEIVFLDNYFFTSEYQRLIKGKGCKLICLGTNDRHYYCDVLLNFAESDRRIFDTELYTEIHLGIEWSILRKPFYNYAPSRTERNSVVICFGGTDQFGLTEKAISAIKHSNINSPIHLIATDSFGIDRLNSLKECGVAVHANLNAEQMVDVLDKAKLLISSASTITIEGLARGVDALAGYYVSNQKKMYESMCSRDLIIGLGDMLDDNFEQVLSDKLSYIGNFTSALNRLTFRDTRNRYYELFHEL